ncbi:hypothetical protein J4461_00750 [Candidatus Pacearchaeota archaeon]|nr:hypothetical protein [Candidatus Pacearchaeota archaeon]
MKSSLKPSERSKVRYILIESKGKEKLEEALINSLGSIGVSKLNMEFIDIKGKKEDKRFVVSINREGVDYFRAACELSPQEIRILKVSGTLKGIKM